MNSAAAKQSLNALVALGVIVCAACTDSTTAATTTTALSSVSLAQLSVSGGTTVTGTVTLSAAAPTGGIAVTLSTNSSAASVPTAIMIGAGSTSTTFAVTTAVTAATVVITATYAGTSVTTTLTLTVAGVAALQTLTLASDVASPGAPVQATVTLTAAAPAGGVAVAISSSNPLIVVPGTATIQAGNTYTTFQIDTSAAPANAMATITAVYAGIVQRAPLAIGTVALSLGGTAPVPGGTSVVATVTLSAPAPDGGAAVALSSSASNVRVPSTVTIPAGATNQTFSIATVDAPPTATATITASYAGTSNSAALTVWAFPTIVGVHCSPGNPSGGATVQCTGSIAPASATGWTLALASDNSAASVPQTVAVAAGASDFQFAIATTAVSAPTTATVQVFDAPTGLVVWRMLLTISP